MGTAKVSDIKSFFPGTAGIGDVKAVNEQGAGDFASVISDAAAKTVPGTQSADAEAIKKAPKSTRPVQKVDNADSKRVVRNEEPGSDNTISKAEDADMGKLEEKVDEKIKEIKTAIKDELGVTDEDIEEAMAALGIAPVGLLNADEIKGLMLELSGETDPMALVTNEELLGSITDVTKLASEMFTQIQDEFGVTNDDLKALYEPANVTDIPVMAAETGPVLEEVNDVDTEKDDNSGVRVEITRSDEAPDTRIMEGSSTEALSLDRKAAQVMNDRKQEDDMQNAMSGQNFTTETPAAESVVQDAVQPTQSYVDNEDIFRQVTDSIKVNITEDATSMELQLHPASLGTVNLQIASNGGVVTAHLLVQNEAVKNVLEGQLVQLLQTFEEQGQKVEAIEVSVAGYDLDRSLNQNTGSDGSDRQERRTEGVGRTTRRRLNLNELEEEDLEGLTEEEQLAAEMMAANGGSVDYTA